MATEESVEEKIQGNRQPDNPWTSQAYGNAHSLKVLIQRLQGLLKGDFNPGTFDKSRWPIQKGRNGSRVNNWLAFTGPANKVGEQAMRNWLQSGTLTETETKNQKKHGLLSK